MEGACAAVDNNNNTKQNLREGETKTVVVARKINGGLGMVLTPGVPSGW